MNFCSEINDLSKDKRPIADLIPMIQTIEPWPQTDFEPQVTVYNRINLSILVQLPVCEQLFA